jgi:hypothetical protein
MLVFMDSVPDEACEVMYASKSLVQSMMSGFDLAKTSKKLHESGKSDKAIILPVRDREISDFRT